MRDIGAKTEDDTVLAWAVGGPYDEGYSFQFAAPRGERLEPRSYVGAQRLPFRDPGRPGMEVVGESRGCNQLVGSFEVRELDRDAQGEVTRLWVVFQQHCEGKPDAAWGEVRINAWAPGAQAATAPGSVRWTALDAWQRATEVPVVYRGGAAVQNATLTGANPGDFTLAAGGCQGRSGPCEVRVGFRPQAAGVRRAAVRFTDAAGAVHETALEGFAHGGTTQADVDVLAGDLAGQPGTYRYGPGDARFAGRTYDTETIVHLDGEDGRYFHASFGAGGATPLTPGQYPGAGTGYGAGPWLDVFGSPTGCARSGGAFTVNEIRRMPDGGLRSFDVAFSHECYADHRPALRGRWRYRAGDSAALAPWLSPGPRPVIAAPPLPSSAGAPAGAAPLTAARAGGGAARGGSAAGFPRPRVSARWVAGRRFTRVRRLRLRALPAGARVQLRCRGRGCPFKRRPVAVRAGKANPGRHLARARLRPGAVLELRVTAAGGGTRILRYTIRRSARPRLARLCRAAGARAAAPCGT